MCVCNVFLFVKKKTLRRINPIIPAYAPMLEVTYCAGIIHQCLVRMSACIVKFVVSALCEVLFSNGPPAGLDSGVHAALEGTVC